MQSVDWTIDGLPEETQSLLKSYVKDVAKLYGNELEGILLYGSAVRGEFLPGRSNLNLLLIISSYDLWVLKKYDSIHKCWSKE
jgi:predicted nucleotidyltransferase